MLSAQQFAPLLIADGDTISVQHAATAAVDMNDDGILDIVLSGDGIGLIADGVFISGGDKTFTISEATNVIAPGFLACMDHGDIDADGDIDFIFNGWVPGGANEVSNGIALNDGSGGFSLDEGYDIGTSAPSSGFADLNNDALLDYFFFGNGAATCAIWFQNADGSFTKDGTSFASYDFVDPQPSIIDFNNDGYLDIFINCWENNVGNRYSKVFINDYFGGFTATDQANIVQKGYGSAVWYDVDADGNLDLLLNGDGGADGESSSDIYRLYKNNNGVLEEGAVFNDYRQISVGGGAQFADFDNDGDADIVLTGWSVTEARQATVIFECADAANFAYTRHAWSDSDQVPGVSESDVIVADFNNDHKIDIVVSGFAGQFGRRVGGVIFNDMADANTVPGAPSNLAHDNIEGGGVIFAWDAGTDAQTPAAALTYSLYLKDKTNDKWLINPEANMATGWRKVTGLGNVDNSLQWPIYELADGDYEWSVQSVDGAYEGSAFPTSLEFTILNGIIDEGSHVLSDTHIENIANIFVNNGDLNIVFMKDVNNAKIKVYTIDGREVINVNASSSNYNSNLKSGLYLVNLTNEGRTQTSKVVVY